MGDPGSLYKPNSGRARRRPVGIGRIVLGVGTERMSDTRSKGVRDERGRFLRLGLLVGHW
jgi:hypothetical protein